MTTATKRIAQFAAILALTTAAIAPQHAYAAQGPVQTVMVVVGKIWAAVRDTVGSSDDSTTTESTPNAVIGVRG
jgi:hypothetical protein